MTAVTSGNRANRKGSPCPRWCTSNHDQVLIPAQGNRPAMYVDVHTGPTHHAGAFVNACAMQQISGDYVLANIAGRTLDVPAGDAEKLAEFLVAVSVLPTSEVARLATAVRDAARDLA